LSKFSLFLRAFSIFDFPKFFIQKEGDKDNSLTIGTGYLAQKQVKNIYKYQADIVAELDSSSNAERVKKNITLAGLLHDLGHAMFSHLFDGRVIPKLWYLFIL